MPKGAVFESSYMNSKTFSYSAASRSSFSSARPVTMRKNRLHILVRDFLGDLGHLRQPRHVALRDGGLELRVQADIARVPQREHGAVEGAGNAAEIVVRLRRPARPG